MSRQPSVGSERGIAPEPIPPGPVPEPFFQTGYERLYAGAPAEAAVAFRAACTADPSSGEAWAALADCAADAGDAVAAATAYGRAAALDETVWPWRLGHAGALHRAGRSADALSAFQTLAGERPDAAAVRLGLGRALRDLGRAEEALAEFREAVALRPDDREAALDLASLLVDCGDALAAVELLQPLARRMPGDSDLHHRIGRAWIALREPDKALTALRRARDLDPEDRAGSAVLIAGLEAGEGTDLSAAYVRALFDRYADRFDRDLLGKLGYAAPDLLRGAVDRLGGGSGLRILDLGCGTGLAGVTFRPLARHLAGVDLSPRMVDKARARTLYDDLQVGDIVAAMDAAAAAWDLLVAADVLVYIGDLDPVFRSAARALADGGRFAATVEQMAEQLDDGGNGFALGPARRYAHTESYLRARAAAAGLTVRLLEPCTPRREKGVGVPGLLFVLEKAG